METVDPRFAPALFLHVTPVVVTISVVNVVVASLGVFTPRPRHVNSTVGIYVHAVEISIASGAHGVIDRVGVGSRSRDNRLRQIP